MIEDDIRRIVREEIAKAAEPRVTPCAWPVQPLPMPAYFYQPLDFSPPMSSGHPPSKQTGIAR